MDSTQQFWKQGRSSNGMYEYKGANGLTLLLVPRKGLGVTTANITYHVGSRNEGLGLKGATHYLEHGMFKGSKNFHGKNGMWKLEELGMYMNATTYTDRTNYFEIMQSKYLKEAVTREADRMLQPLLTQELLDSEMTVVRNEFERGNNNDFEIAHKRMTATAFMAHPYHHSTIGWKSDIENVSAEALQKFHKTFYVPNNATYTFVGNFDPEEVKDLVEESFKNIPKGKDIPEMYTKEPEQMGQRRVTIERPTRTSLLGIGFKSVHGLNRDAIVNKVLARYLTDGPDSVMEDLRKDSSVNIHDVMASFERMKDPYLFNVWVTTNYSSPEVLKTAEVSVMDKLMNIKAPTEKQLQIIKNKIKFGWQNSMETTKGMSSEINESIARGNAFDVYEKFDVLDSVTPEDILRVAKYLFNPRQSTVVEVLPGDKVPTEKARVDYGSSNYDTSPPVLEKPNSSSLKFDQSTTSNLEHTFTDYDTSKVHVRMSLQSKSDYTVKEYVSRLMLSEMLSKGIKLKNKVYDESQVQQFYDKNGIQRNFSIGDLGLRVHMNLPQDSSVKATLKLLKNELSSPLMSEKDFMYIKSKLMAELRGSSNSVNGIAKVLMNQKLFKEGSVHYRHSYDEMVSTLQSLTYNDMIKEHQKALNGNNVLTVLAENPQVVNFDDIGKNSMMQGISEPLKTTNEVIKHFLPGKTSCTVLMGMHVEPDLATQIAVNCLGNGFSGKLMKHVRDELGLTYGINSYVKEKQGTMHVSATYSPTLLDKGIKETHNVLDEWKKGVTQEEVDIQKTIMTGIRQVRFDNPSNIINTIHSEKLRGKDMNFIDSFDTRVNAVTLEQVNQAIANIDLSELSTVIVGTFS